MSLECLRISKLAKLDTFELSEDRLLQNGKIWEQKFMSIYILPLCFAISLLFFNKSLLKLSALLVSMPFLQQWH